MEPEAIAVLRFDYILSKHTEEVLSRLSDWFGEDPNTRLSWTGVRGDKKVDQTFQMDDPKEIGLNDFDLYAVRVIDISDIVTEIVSVATVQNSKLSEIADEELSNTGVFPCREWRRSMSLIRTKIPGEQKGPETTMIWVKPDNIPTVIEDPSSSISRIEQEFRDGSPSRFLNYFNTSVSRGMTRLGRNSLLFSKEPGMIYGELVTIDIGGKLDNPILQFGHGLAGEFSQLSLLYGIHYWCAVRGKALTEIETRIKQARDEFPSQSDSVENIDDYLRLDSEIYNIQKDWGTLYTRVSSGHKYFEKEIKELDIEIDEGTHGRLEEYIRSLNSELNIIENDLQRVNMAIGSISSYISNQTSIISSKKSIKLQEEIRSQTESSSELQQTVKHLTWIIVILTAVLVLDALMTGGIASFIDQSQDIINYQI